MYKSNSFNLGLRYVIYAALALAIATTLLIDKSYLFPFISSKIFFFRGLIEVAFFGFLVLLVRDKAYRVRPRTIGWALVAYVLVVLISSLTGVNPLKSLWGTIERGEGFLTLIHLFAFFVVLVGVVRDKLEWRRLLSFQFVISVAVALYALGQFFGLESFINTTGSRLSGTIGNASFLAGYLLMNAFLGLYLLLQTRERVWKYILGLGIALELFIIFQTQTRGAILALVVGALLMLVVVGVSRGSAKRTRSLSLLVIGLIVLAGLGVYALRDTSFIKESRVLHRLATISPRSVTGQTRLLTWATSFEAFKDRPILGWGYENYNYAFDTHFPTPIYIDNGSQIWFDRAHNVVIGQLVSFGALGLLAYGVLFLLVLRQLILLMKRDHARVASYMALVALLAAYFIQNLFVFDTLPTYIVLFLFLAYVAWSERETSETGPGRKINVVVASAVPFVAAILLVLSVYHFNIKPATANLEGAESLRLIRAGQLGNSQVLMQKALARETYQSAEIRQQYVARILDLRNDLRADAEAGKFAFVGAYKEAKILIAHDPLNARNYLLALGIINTADGADLLAVPLEDILDLGQQAKQRSPDRTHIYYETAQTNVNHGRFTEALLELEIALELSPKVGSVYFNFILVEARQGNWEEVRVWLLRAMDPVSEVVLTNNDRDRIINVLAEGRRFDDLVTFYQHLIEQGGSQVVAYWQQLAAVYGELGDIAKARAAALRAAELDPALQEAAQEFMRQLESGSASSDKAQ